MVQNRREFEDQSVIKEKLDQIGIRPIRVSHFGDFFGGHFVKRERKGERKRRRRKRRRRRRREKGREEEEKESQERYGY